MCIRDRAKMIKIPIAKSKSKCKRRLIKGVSPLTCTCTFLFIGLYQFNLSSSMSGDVDGGGAASGETMGPTAEVVV